MVVMNLSKDLCVKIMRHQFGIKEPSQNLLEGRRKSGKPMSRWPVTGHSNYTHFVAAVLQITKKDRRL